MSGTWAKVLLAAATMIGVGSGGVAYGADFLAVSYSSQSYTSYSYQIGNGDSVGGNGDRNTVRFRNAAGDANSVRLALNTTSTYDRDSFHFLQNGYCIGSCYATATTTLSVDITNNGPDPLDLRFDSIIIPGHLAAQAFGFGSDTNANFDFSVTEGPGGPNPVRTDAPTELYRATGQANFQEISIDTSDGQRFNGLTLYEAAGQTVYDWSATNLNLVLSTLAAGDTTRITYTTTTSIFGNASGCTRLALCDGAQVAFGDPRKNGGVTALARSAGLRAAVSDPEPVIGRQFDPAEVPFEVVLADAPLPPQPRVLPPVDYATFGSAVPEPQAWALFIAGIAVLGIGLRRRALVLRPI